MFNFTFRTKALIAGCLAFVAIQIYSFASMRSSFDERMASLEREFQIQKVQSNAKATEMTANLELMAERMGVTAQELDRARETALQLRQEQDTTAARLRRELAAKADSQSVEKLRADATSQFAEIQQDTTSRFGNMNGQVEGVRLDLDSTKNELAASRRELGDVRLLVARNAGELDELRRRGERDYFEFDIRKSKDLQRIAEIRLQLKKADVKKQRFDIVMMVDDSQIEEKGRAVNVPVQFLVGRDRLRYELVVNYVDKDRIRGYISTPKDKVLSAEGPSFRK
jgi:hypothetical protein